MSPVAKKPAPEVLLGAGALVSFETVLPPDAHSDAVCARAYQHPALGDRVVVRLPSSPLAPAEDLELELLGFGGPTVADDVARRRQRALGFPGWALVNDPKRARYALELVKGLKKAAKTARSKPGFAKEQFDALGKTLARTVPTFLPSFFEEAGRAFIVHGNLTFAATMFTKAREAEKVHNLKVDREARQRAFLEFALAGALTGKVLSEYASELAETESPAQAYASFRQLAVRRVLGGLPPWTGMGKELRRLVKAAGLDLMREDQALLEELLDAPSLARAPMEFWSTYEPAIIALAQRSAGAKAALLRLTPEPNTGDRPAFITSWLALIDRAGALAPLLGPRADTPPEIAQAVTPADWLKRMLGASVSWRQVAPDAIFATLRRIAPRLLEERTPLALSQGRVSSELELFELALELGVPLADPPEHFTFSLRAWAANAASSPERGGDPARLAQEPRFRPALERGVQQSFGEEDFEAAAQGKASLRELRHAHLLATIKGLTGGVEQLRHSLSGLSDVVSARTFAEFPDAYEALQPLSAAPSLARTVQVGLFDEFGWPALEEAWRELAGPKGTCQVTGFFPYLCVFNAARVVVLGPTGRVLTHDFHVPPRHKVEGCLFVGGQVRVTLRTEAYEERLYWSGSPDALVDSRVAYGLDRPGLGVELADGGLTIGGRALYVGDTGPLEQHGEVLSDGTTFWRWQFEGGKSFLIEFDPRTGKAGRRSRPRFFSEPAADEPAADGPAYEEQRAMMHLYPVPAELSSSPLGVRDGLTGLRVRRGEGGELERTDGLKAKRAPGQAPAALLLMPGSTTPLPVVTHWRSCSVLEPDGSTASLFDINAGPNGSLMLAGTPYPPPVEFWSYLTARDEAGSRALRAVSLSTCERLLEAGLADRASSNQAEAPTVSSLVATLLPEVTHPQLRAGLIGVVREAAAQQEALTRALAKWHPSGASASSGRSDEALADALESICAQSYGSGTTLDQLREVERLLTTGTLAPLSSAKVFWERLIGRAGAVLFLAAASAGVEPRAREELVLLAEAFADCPTLLDGARFRRLTFTFPEGTPQALKASANTLTAWKEGPRLWLLREPSYNEKGRWRALEYLPQGGEPRAPDGADLGETETIALPGLTAEAIKAFATRLRAQGAPALSLEPIDLVASETGLTRAEAALLWLGLPSANDWKRDFLDADVREALGLKVTAANIAREALQRIDLEVRAELFSAAMGSRPLDAWDAPLEVARRFAAAWNHKVGKRATLPSELLAEAKAYFKWGVNPTTALAAIADPTNTAFARDGVFSLVNGELRTAAKPGAPEGYFDDALAGAAALYLPWLYTARPVGDPVRAGIPRFLDEVRARLANPELIFAGSSHYPGEGGSLPLLQALGGAIEKSDSQLQLVDTGAALATANAYRVTFFIRPASWSPEHPQRKLIVPARQHPGVDTIGAVEALRSQGFTALAERVRSTPVPVGGYEANPLASVPKLVRKVAAKQGLSDEAAGLYLQMLGLLHPSAKDVQRFNGWSAKQYQAAAGELLKKKLLVEAKRERAGRDVFLPGAWEPLKAPDLPFESWKLPLYGLRRSGEALVRPLGSILALEPIHRLFERAAQRLEAGDVPRFDEVKSR